MGTCCSKDSDAEERRRKLRLQGRGWHNVPRRKDRDESSSSYSEERAQADRPPAEDAFEGLPSGAIQCGNPLTSPRTPDTPSSSGKHQASEELTGPEGARGSLSSSGRRVHWKAEEAVSSAPAEPDPSPRVQPLATTTTTATATEPDDSNPSPRNSSKRKVVLFGVVSEIDCPLSPKEKKGNAGSPRGRAFPTAEFESQPPAAEGERGQGKFFAPGKVTTVLSPTTDPSTSPTSSRRHHFPDINCRTLSAMDSMSFSFGASSPTVAPQSKNSREEGSFPFHVRSPRSSNSNKPSPLFPPTTGTRRMTSNSDVGVGDIPPSSFSALEEHDEGDSPRRHSKSIAVLQALSPAEPTPDSVAELLMNDSMQLEGMPTREQHHHPRSPLVSPATAGQRRKASSACTPTVMSRKQQQQQERLSRASPQPRGGEPLVQMNVFASSDRAQLVPSMFQPRPIRRKFNV